MIKRQSLPSLQCLGSLCRLKSTKKEKTGGRKRAAGYDSALVVSAVSSFEEGMTLSLESLKKMDTCSKTTKKGAGMGEKEKACKFLVIHSINYVNVPI